MRRFGILATMAGLLIGMTGLWVGYSYSAAETERDARDMAFQADWQVKELAKLDSIREQLKRRDETAAEALRVLQSRLDRLEKGN